MPGDLSLFCKFLDLSSRNLDETIGLNSYGFGFCLFLYHLFHGLRLVLDSSFICLILVLRRSGSRSHPASCSALAAAVSCSKIKLIKGRFSSLWLLLFRGQVVALFLIASGSLPSLLLAIFVLKLLQPIPAVSPFSC